MLDKLLNCKSYEELDNLAIIFIMNPSQSMHKMLEDIKCKNLVFNINNYLSKENLSRYVLNQPLVEKALSSFSKEDEQLCILHTIQLFGACCPSIKNMVDDILIRTTI